MSFQDEEIRAEAEKLLAVINERDRLQHMYFPLDERCPHCNINTKSLIEECIRRGMEMERERRLASVEELVSVAHQELRARERELVKEWRTRGESINDYAPNVCADELEKILGEK